MNFLKALFGSKEESPEEKKKAEETKNFNVLKYDGVRAMRSNQTEYAIKCFTHALQMQDDLEINDYLSQAYIRLGDMTSAYEQLQKLADAQPDNQQIFVRMAHVAFMQEDYAAMSDACEKALGIKADSPEVMYLKAKALIGQDETAKAVEQLTAAITLNAGYGDAYLLRGETRLAEGAVQEADDDAAWLLERAPENEDVLMLKARIERLKGNASEAIAYYDKVTDVNPFHVNAYRERGELKLATGDEHGGQADIDQARELQSGQDVDVTADGIEAKIKQAYKNMDPYNVFSN